MTETETDRKMTDRQKADRHTDMTKPIDVFRNVVKAAKKSVLT